MWDRILSNIDQSMTPQKAVLLWEGDVNTLELVSSGINLVYRFSRNNQVCYLRLTHSQLRSLSELEAAIAFQMYLQEKAIPLCPLVFSSNDCIIESIQQDDDMWLAHVVAGVPGEPMHFNYDKTCYKRWGSKLGLLHLASKNYPADQHHYGRWENDIAELKDYAKTENKIIQHALATVLDYFKIYPQTIHNYGLIHGDHRKGNVLTNGKNIYFIDFDLPRFCWFMDDISRPFFSSIMKEEQNWQDKLSYYIEGYRSVLDLHANDLAAFPWFIRYKAINMYLWTKHNWTNHIAPGGENTKTWLRLLYNMIKHQDWEKELALILKTL